MIVYQIHILDIQEQLYYAPKSYLSQITLENSPLKNKVCKVSAMLIEEDTKALRHARIMEWRDDISYEDCTYEKAFGGIEWKNLL